MSVGGVGGVGGAGGVPSTPLEPQSVQGQFFNYVGELIAAIRVAKDSGVMSFDDAQALELQAKGVWQGNQSSDGATMASALSSFVSDLQTKLGEGGLNVEFAPFIPISSDTGITHMATQAAGLRARMLNLQIVAAIAHAGRPDLMTDSKLEGLQGGLMLTIGKLDQGTSTPAELWPEYVQAVEVYNQAVHDPNMETSPGYIPPDLSLAIPTLTDYPT